MLKLGEKGAIPQRDNAKKGERLGKMIDRAGLTAFEQVLATN